MAEEFDMGAALAEMSEGLGFEGEGESNVDDSLDNAIDDSIDNAGTSTDELGGEQSDKPVAGKGTEKAEGTPSEVDTTKAPVPTSTAPRTWRPEAAAEWAKVPEVVQKEIAKREEDMWNGIEQYKTDAGFGKTMQKVIEPFSKVLADNKIDPVTAVNGLLNAQYRLVYGTPQQKVSMFQNMMRDYGITIDHLTGLEELPQPDKEVEALRNELNTVKSTLTEQQQRDYQNILQQKSQEVHAFAADPKNVHFEAVADDIVQLIRNGVCKTLPEAYEKAVWANPVTRASEITRQQAEKDRIAEQERKEQTDKAKETLATNVRSRQRSASTAAPLGTMDDTMQATLAAIKARESK